MKKILTFAAIAAALSLSSCAGTDGSGKTEGYVGYVPLSPFAACGNYCGDSR